MSIPLDLAVYNRDDELELLIEVKKMLNTSREWAARFHRNILAHGTLPLTNYFLLALPDRFYLWKEVGMELKTSDVEPTYTVDAHPILEPYFEQVGVFADHISSEGFELIIASWLRDLVYADMLPESDSSQQWLIESGVYEAIAGGRLAHEVVA